MKLMAIVIRQSFRLLYRNLQSTFLVSKILDNALRFLWIVPKSGAKSFLLRLKSQLVWHQRQRYLLNAPRRSTIPLICSVVVINYVILLDKNKI
jgi:hypothetical protein